MGIAWWPDVWHVISAWFVGSGLVTDCAEGACGPLAALVSRNQTRPILGPNLFPLLLLPESIPTDAKRPLTTKRAEGPRQVVANEAVRLLLNYLEGKR